MSKLSNIRACQIEGKKAAKCHSLCSLTDYNVSVRRLGDSAAIRINLLAVTFHRNIDIAEHVSTNRLKMVIFLIVKFPWNKISKFKEIETCVNFLPWSRQFRPR